MDKTDCNRNEIWFRSDNVRDEQVSSEPTEDTKDINYMQKLLESLGDCI